MDIGDIFHSANQFIEAALFLLSPVYLFYFIWRRIKAGKINLKTCPSSLTLAVYIIMMFIGYNYEITRHMHGRSAEWEAMTNLSSIATANIGYFAEKGHWAGENNENNIFKNIGWSPSGTSRYVYYCDHDVIEPNKKYFSFKYPKFDDNWPYSIRPGVSADGFTCMAIGNLDKDDFLDIWMVNQDHTPKQIQSDRYNEAIEKTNMIEPNQRKLARKKVLDEFMSLKGLFFLVNLIGVPILVFLIYRDEKHYRQAPRKINA